MIMIVGGAYQGKLDFALSLTGFRKEDFADGRSCGMDELKAAPGVFSFHEFVRRTLEGSGENRQLPGQGGSSGEDSPGYDFDFPDAFARELAGELIRANPELVVITDEIGCGIVPMDAGESIAKRRNDRHPHQAVPEPEDLSGGGLSVPEPYEALHGERRDSVS